MSEVPEALNAVTELDDFLPLMQDEQVTEILFSHWYSVYLTNNNRVFVTGHNMHEAFLIFREGFNEIPLELKMDENIKHVVLLNSAIYLLSDKNRVFLFTQDLDFFVEIIIERKENEYIETIFGQKQSKDEVENDCYLSTNLQRLFLLQESFYQEITYENAKTLMFNNHIFVIDDQCFLCAGQKTN